MICGKLQDSAMTHHLLTVFKVVFSVSILCVLLLDVLTVLNTSPVERNGQTISIHNNRHGEGAGAYGNSAMHWDRHNMKRDRNNTNMNNMKTENTNMNNKSRNSMNMPNMIGNNMNKNNMKNYNMNRKNMIMNNMNRNDMNITVNNVSINMNKVKRSINARIINNSNMTRKVNSTTKNVKSEESREHSKDNGYNYSKNDYEQHTNINKNIHHTMTNTSNNDYNYRQHNAPTTSHSNNSNVSSSSTPFVPSISIYPINQIHQDLHQAPDPSVLSPGFRPSLSHELRARYVHLVEVFAKEVRALGLCYFMYGGTLLGSWRHHGFIPWDDDVDLIVSYSNRSALKEGLKKLSPDYRLHAPADAPRWKFYYGSDPSIGNYTWAYPFIDISFFVETSTVIRDCDPGFAKTYKFPKSIVFPLVARPFENVTLLAPRHTLRFLTKTYGDVDADCVTLTWNHRLEETVDVQKVQRIPCTTLFPYNPFVFRSKSENSDVVETLRIGDQVVRREIIPAS